MTSTVAQEQAARTLFFEYLFGETKGLLCVATSAKDRTDFKQFFFRWPTQKKDAATFIDQQAIAKNVWFCTSLLDDRKRTKENCLPGNIVWADLDDVDPKTLDLKPSIAIESSPGRYQAYWRMDQIIAPDTAELYSKKLAYSIDADKSGWDLTQLLRVPLTHNFKYEETPEVNLLWANLTYSSILDFEKLPAIEENGGAVLETMGDIPIDPPSPDVILYKYSYLLQDTAFFPLYADEPHDTDDWSARMWRLINVCHEIGMTTDEAFSVCRAAKCNKFQRDNRPITYLWREIKKAYALASKEFTARSTIEKLMMPELVPLDYIPQSSFISDYRRWAEYSTDAVPEFHELSAFIILSSLMSAGIKVNTIHGPVYTNLWGLVLGDSTLTRKTTAMRMAMDLVDDVDDSALLATDGSAEGLLTGLSQRPKRVSIFFRDEVAGFFDGIARKDYLAGLPELLTELYDVPRIKTRMLRKETITIARPYFVFFGGGIRDKMYELVSEGQITSGFIPRFLIVSGETDLNRLRRTGPATTDGTADRERILFKLRDLHDTYNKVSEVKIGGQITTLPTEYEALLSDDAWERFGQIEDALTQAANKSHLSAIALPTFTRLAFSILKMSVLLACSRNDPDEKNKVHVNVMDIDDAAYYGQRFGKHSIGLIMNAGLSMGEKSVQRVLRFINNNPGKTKSTLMQTLKLNARDSKDILETLAQRGVITAKKEGRGMTLWPVEA